MKVTMKMRNPTLSCKVAYDTYYIYSYRTVDAVRLMIAINNDNPTKK